MLNKCEIILKVYEVVWDESWMNRGRKKGRREGVGDGKTYSDGSREWVDRKCGPLKARAID